MKKPHLILIGLDVERRENMAPGSLLNRGLCPAKQRNSGVMVKGGNIRCIDAWKNGEMIHRDRLVFLLRWLQIDRIFLLQRIVSSALLSP